MQRPFVMLVAIAGLAGCEPEATLLPTELSGRAVRTITSSGGTVDSPEGAAIHFRQGSLGISQLIGIESTSPPAEMTRAGQVVSPAFEVGPDGLALGRSATVALRYDPQIDPSRAWLATIVGVANGLLQAYSGSRVDVASGVVEGEVEELGTFAVMIPDQSMIAPVTRSSVRASAVPSDAPDRVSEPPTDSITVFCGGSVTPCTGTVATATDDLLSKVRSAVLLFPSMAGSLRLRPGAVSGSISLSASLRFQLESSARTETVWLNARIEPTESTVAVENRDEILLTNVRVRTAAGLGLFTTSNEEITTLAVVRSDHGGVISIGRSFRIPGITTQPTRFTIEMPVNLRS